MPEGPAVVCANHSNYIDPLLVAAAFGKENYMHFMAKLELQRVPVVGAVLKKCGICFVDRGKSDIDAVRSIGCATSSAARRFLYSRKARAWSTTTRSRPRPAP
ncbi:MAG: lysophospholipid acyltransferase family protein [Lachnospiraceae bacterium]